MRIVWEDEHMKQRRLKIFAASIILLSGFVILVLAMTKKESMRELTPVKLIANAETMDNQNVQLVGAIYEESTAWNADEFKLTFAVRELEETATKPEDTETVNVIYNKLKPDNFIDGGNVFVEGKYDAEQNVIIANKVTTKCASKYEKAESAKTTDGSY
jgi:cytochrome c-type biogenesis protein CcmE